MWYYLSVLVMQLLRRNGLVDLADTVRLLHTKRRRAMLVSTPVAFITEHENGD